MRKNILFSMVMVFCSTLLLLSFLAVGLFFMDKLVREEIVEAGQLARVSSEHTNFTKSLRLRDKDVTVFLQLRNPEEEVIKIAFAGDVMMEGSIARAMNKYGDSYPFLQVQQELSEVDYAIVNLETAVTTRGTKYEKQFNFRTGLNSLIALREAGFDMVSLANNHTMDYGEEGLLDTIKYVREAGLDFVGAGKNSDEAYKAHFMKIKGKKIAILGFSRVLPSGNWYATPKKPGIASGYQVDRMVRIVEEVKAEVDYLFVFMHWGIERQQIPESYQFRDARTLIDSGADGVIGAHPHVLQGLDYYKGKPIAYSLGNFLFPDYVRGLTAESCVLTLIIQGDEIKMKYTPYLITGNQVAALSEEDTKARVVAMEKLSFHVKREGNIFFERK